MIPLILGAFLILLAIIGKRFHAGLMTRTQIPAWQGRTWLLLMGGSLFLFGLASLLHSSSAATWLRVLDAATDGYEIFIGGFMMLLGALFAAAGKGKAPVQARWLAAAASLAGAIVLFDGVTKIIS